MAKYIQLLILSCIIYALKAQTVLNGCDSGWVPYNNNCYMINTIKSISRAAAQTECNNRDSSLLRIESQDQQSWLLNTLKQYPSSGYWTDLNDIPKVAAERVGTGVWKWGMYEYANMSLIIWNQSPANDGQSNCGAVNIQGRLADLKCSVKQGFICKYKPPSTAPGCPLAWIPGANGCYWVANTSDPSALQTWDEAKSFCEGTNPANVKATLFVVDDQNDATFLSGEIPYLSQTTKTHWVGLQNQGGKWQWYTGKALDTSIIKWQSEPDNVAGIENCGIMRMTGVFSDRDCTSNANFICYKPQNNYSPSDNIGCGPWIRAGKFCYGFVSGTMKKTWPDARSYCQSKGGDLMKIDSFDKKSWLNQQMLDPGNSQIFWVGLNDRKQDGTYVWADGTPINTSYVVWNSEPNDFRGDEDCATIYPTGQYNDFNCGLQASAICELDNAPTCPSLVAGWKSFGGNCYLFTASQPDTMLMNQNEAAAYCATFSTNSSNIGALLSVDNAQEKQFILSQVKTMQGSIRGWWTSLNDKQTEGFWRFKSGPLTDLTLVDWKGEPNTNKGMDCGMVNYGGVFHEIQCTSKVGFICERYATGYNAGVNIEASLVVSTVLAVLARLAVV